MTDAVVVFCSCADEAEAARIGRTAVESGVAACATITGAVQSIFRWQGAIETAREALLMLKTTASEFPALQNLVLSLHSYETPEILAVPVLAGSERYLSWLSAQLGNHPDGSKDFSCPAE